MTDAPKRRFDPGRRHLTSGASDALGNEPTFRRARMDEPDALALIEQVQGWYVQIYGGRDEDPLVPDEFAPPRGGCWLAHLGERPVAMGGWTGAVVPELGPEPVGIVHRMYVVPDLRRHGLADRLLAEIEVSAQAAGITRLVLTTGGPQQAAVAFYRSHGFVDVPAYGFYADDGAVHLGKALSGRGAPRPA